jgi:hypothetical protein
VTIDPGKIGLLVFDAVPGQRVTVALTNFDVTVERLNIAIFAPGPGFALVGPQSGSHGSDRVVWEPVLLPKTGTYTLYFENAFANSANFTVTIYDVPPDFTASITPGGPPVTVTTTTPGQNASLTFSGTAGQRISLNLTNGTIPASVVTIFNPDGTKLVDPGTPPIAFGTSGFIDTRTLPATGTYRILVDPQLTDTGSLRLRLFNVPPDVTATISIGGPDVTVTTTVPGQNARLTFSGTAAQPVTVQVVSNGIGLVTLSLLRADGTVLASTTSGATSFNLPQQTLPATETYAILVDPSAAKKGSITLRVTSP